MVPTEAGSRLLERSTTILSLTRELADDVRLARERIVLACTGTITTQLVPAVLLELERDRPIRLGIRRAGGSACEHLVRNGDIDLGVVRASSPPRGLASKHLTDDRLWLVVPAEPRRPRTRAISLQEMAALPLVLYGSSSRTRARHGSTRPSRRKCAGRGRRPSLGARLRARRVRRHVPLAAARPYRRRARGPGARRHLPLPAIALLRHRSPRAMERPHGPGCRGSSRSPRTPPRARTAPGFPKLIATGTLGLTRAHAPRCARGGASARQRVPESMRSSSALLEIPSFS